MKIGILTFCNAYNLGGALQAFSLQKALEETGQDAELIDYRCPAIENMHKLRPVLHRGISLKSRVYNIIHNIVFFPRRIRYKKFQQCMKRSRKYSRDNVHEANGQYDMFITGSDQVFNLKLTGDDSTYFLDFVDKGIKASYAASLGIYLPDQKERYQHLLKTFDYLSVREKSTADIFEKELGIVAEDMPDPVFLHTADEWKTLVGVSADNKHKYVLVYSLIENKDLYDIANKVAKERGLKVFAITKVLRPMGHADKCFRNAGPKEFIELIANADYVVTNSFHGTAFSLIFEKQFTTLKPASAPERIEDLLASVNLHQKITESSRQVDCRTIDYNCVREVADHIKEKGTLFIENMIRTAKNVE